MIRGEPEPELSLPSNHPEKPDGSILLPLSESMPRCSRPIHNIMCAWDGRHWVWVSHEVVRAAEGCAASDEKSLVLIQVPADRAVVLASVGSALAGDDRRRDGGVGANHDPRVYVVSNWFRTV